jgi:hypothetical protein
MKSFDVLRKIKQKLMPAYNGAAIYPNSARKTGCLIMGQPGTGKTRHLEAWIMDDILAGRGVGVFDVHGPLFHNILYRLAALYEEHPQLAKRLVVIDPTSQADYLVTFNPLAAIEGLPLERIAGFMSDVIIKIWNINTTESPRLAYLMAQSFLALADLGLTLLDLPRFLSDKQWRDSLLPHLAQEGALNYFRHEFPNSPKEVPTWTNPLLNKVGPILFDQQLAIFFAANAKISFRQIMDQQKILLVHLPKGIIGEGAASLLGALTMAMIQKAALSREVNPDLPQFYLYLDEFQNYTTTHISDALAESRKFKLTLLMAHQFGAQIRDEELKSAVINTTGTMISFRIGHNDARSLVAPNLFPSSDYLAHLGISGWEGLATELANLPDRVYWLRRRGPFAPVKKYTREMPDPVVTPKLEANLAKMLAVSGRLYGRSRAELLQELAAPGTDHAQPLTTSQRRRQRKKQKRMNLAAESAMLEAHEQPSGSRPDYLPEATNGAGRGNLDELWN